MKQARSGRSGWSGLVCGVMLLTSPAVLAGEHNNSSLTIEYGGDSQDTQDAFIELQLGAGPNAYIYFNGSRMEAKDQYSEITATGYNIGFNSIANDPVGATIEYGFWGNHGEIEISSIRAGFDISSEHLYFSITPQIRAINMTAFIPTVGRREFDISSPGYSAQAGVYFLEHWNLSAGFARNRYSADLTVLASRPIFSYLLSPTTLSLASGFEKTRLESGLAYQWDRHSLGVSWMRSESAVDLTETDIWSANIDIGLSKQWQWTLQGGRQYPESGDETNFGSTGLTYRW